MTPVHPHVAQAWLRATLRLIDPALDGDYVLHTVTLGAVPVEGPVPPEAHCAACDKPTLVVSDAQTIYALGAPGIPVVVALCPECYALLVGSAIPTNPTVGIGDA